ncbi:YgfZ/GcvT domain-containing protein [Primorskyibacter sp. S187A]|uniref:CAF17-like 4Fe-4S cluster assembly/insertion protein YgfZ n=1 Tax=Primorskyibacter sp. S187A TaxID=3415130 RepID=UPI003C7E6800
MSTYHTTRKVIAVSGAEARDFLQGLITNDVAALDHGLVYAALLTPQGKFLADFFLEQRGATILIDVAAERAPDLLKRLTMYRLRSPIGLEMTELKVSRGTGTRPDGAKADPRHRDMGWRLIAEEALPEDGTVWPALHVALAIPQTDIELTPDSYILEMGFERLSGVDFRKGCFVGQEIVARMKHKTELRKGLARVRIQGEATPGTEITAQGKPAGILHSRAGDEALAYLRFDRSKGPLEAGDADVELIEQAITASSP